MPVADVFSRVDWAKRSAEFGPLDQYVSPFNEELVVMPLRTPGLDEADLDWGLWDQWSALPRQRTLFDAVASRGAGGILLRFAAIDWSWRPDSIENQRAVANAATWGIELTRAYDFIRVGVTESDLGWFACPFTKIDIHGQVRVGFLNPAGNVELMRRIPPEVLEHFPAADERALVFAIGQLLLGLIAVTGKGSRTPFGQIILRCLSNDRSARFESLASLREALTVVGASRYRPEPYESERAWQFAEQAIGYKLLERPERAALLLSRAVRVAPFGYLDNLIRELGFDPQTIVGTREPSLTRVKRRPPTAPPPTAQRTKHWSQVRETVGAHLQAGRYRDAIALLNETILDDADAAEILVTTADCYLNAREYGPAIDYAEQALARTPSASRAYGILAEGRFKRREFEVALAALDAWTRALPHDGHAHYVCGKTLLALGRLAEARDACERSLELPPKHLPAMMLRRQIDRTIKRVRVQAGTSQRVPVDLPEHLRDLRPLLVAGKTADAITMLEGPQYANDPAARLLRADLLAFTEQLEAAEAAYAALGGVAAGVGRVLVLVKLGRASDALAAADVLVKEHANVADAHEARALALQQLGRGSEADDELRRAAAADRQRSQMRVQLAKL